MALTTWFAQWKTNGLLKQINRTYNQLYRQQEGKAAYPAKLNVDSQRAKLTPMIYEHRSWNGHKNVNGR